MLRAALATALVLVAPSALAQKACEGLPSAAQLKKYL